MLTVRADRLGRRHVTFLAGQPAPDVVLPQPPTFSVTFVQPGSYDYLCLLHDGMVGTIVVEPAN
jgi:plastocyanin